MSEPKRHTYAQAKRVAGHVRRWKMTFQICWIVIGVIQIITIVFGIAGIWNIVNSAIGICNTSHIQAGNRSVYLSYKNSLQSLVYFAVINIFLGGVIGIFVVVGNLLLRNYVIKHKWAFDPSIVVPGATTIRI